MRWWPGRRVRTPTFLQMETAECGATALAIVLAHYGRRVPLEELRHACNVTRDGTSARNILEAARSYGMQAVGLKKELSELAGMKLPLIVFWELKHFVVLEGVGRRYFYINDPAIGPVRVDAAQFERSFTGIVLKLEPGPEFQKAKMGSGILRVLLSRAGGAVPALIFVVLASLALVVPELLFPAFTRVYIDHFLVQRLSDWVRPLILAMIGTGLLVAVISWLQHNALARLQIKLSVTSTTQFFGHLLQLPITFFLQRDAGSLATRVALNDRLAQLLADQLGATICKVLVVVFFGVVMWQFDHLLTLISVGIAMLNFLALKWAARQRIDGNRRLLRDREKTGSAAMNGLQIMETLKAAGQESEFFVRWLGLEVNLLNSEQQLGLSTRLLGSLPPLLLAIDVAMVLGIGGLRVIDGRMTIGMLVAFQALNFFLLDPIAQLVELGGALQEAEGDASRLDDVLRVHADKRSASTAIASSSQSKADSSPTQLVGDLQLKGITFGYSRLDPPLLEDFSLHLHPGRRIAIVGGTGSGKSTVARLVAGLYEPWKGQVLFDGIESEQIKPEVIKRSVAMVDQDVVLFPGTVRDNLTLWNQDVSEADIVAAARDACVHDEIERRAFGYDGLIAEGGVNFSGGQRQQLEIARALALNPAILILDEATSALDPATEVAIVANLRARGCACLIIAHRLSTIRDSHEIIVLDNGTVVQRGTHATLREAAGAYLQLLREGQQLANVPVREAALRRSAPSDDEGLSTVRQSEEGGPTDAALAASCRIVAEAGGLAFVTVPRSHRIGGDENGVQQIHAEISGIAAANRFRARRVSLHHRWWRNSEGPLVGFVDEERRPIALVPAGGKGYRAIDPTTGDSVALDSALRARLDSHAYVFSKPFPAQELTGRELLRFSSEDCHPELIRMLWTAAAGGILALSVPVATGVLFDSLIPEADRRGLLELVALLIVIALCGAMFRLSGAIAAQRAQAKMELAAQSGLWDRLLSLPASFFRQYAVGDLADRAAAFNQMRLVLTDSLISAVLGIIFSLISFIILFVLSPPLAVLATALALISAGVTAVVGWRQVRCQRALYDQAGKTSSLVLQLLSGITKLRVAGAEGRALALWTKRFGQQQRLALAGRKIVNQLLAFNSGFSMIATAVIFVAMYWIVGSEKLGRHSESAALSTGRFLAFIAAFVSFLQTTGAASAALVNAMRVLPIYERARPILRALPESDSSKAPAGALTGGVEVANVSFRYPDQPPIIRDMSLKISPGEFVAIVGPSGSGKSTLLRLLLGFEVPETGSIRYDGRDLATLDLQTVRRQFGVVLQNGALFPGSIFMNIVGALPLTMEDAWDGARRAGLEEVIRQMPMGMYTQVGEGAATLSGGQRQQLMIARSLVGNPRIFLLDEATSALDNITQAWVSRSLERLKVTRILIAHRLSTVRNADRILVMNNGQIVQSGTYDELAAQPGLFADLASRQSI